MLKLKSLACIILLVTVLVSLVSCVNQNEKAFGTWEMECDISEYLNAGMEAGSPKYAKYFVINSFKISLKITFNDDGTYTFEVDKDKFVSAFEGLKPTFVEGMKLLYKESAESLQATEEELLSMAGKTYEELTDEVMAGMDPAAMANELKVEGQYIFRGGKLLKSDTKDDSPDKKSYELYEFTDEDTITLTGYVGDDAENNIFTYPLVLKKVK